jgi:hypothetical protein
MVPAAKQAGGHGPGGSHRERGDGGERRERVGAENGEGERGCRTPARVQRAEAAKASSVRQAHVGPAGRGREASKETHSRWALYFSKMSSRVMVSGIPRGLRTLLPSRMGIS